MTQYRINEIFYSLQGEGHHTGTPAVFLRFSGCNLKCPFCDTDHSEGVLMSSAEIVGAVSQYPAHHIVVTGGEPGLQLDSELCRALHAAGFYIQVETNGSRPLPCAEIDWITCSPKCEFADGAALCPSNRIDELKVVFDGRNDMSVYDPVIADESIVLSLQPCDTGDAERNAAIQSAAITYILGHPRWHLSLQTHKLLSIR